MGCMAYLNNSMTTLKLMGLNCFFYDTTLGLCNTLSVNTRNNIGLTSNIMVLFR